MTIIFVANISPEHYIHSSYSIDFSFYERFNQFTAFHSFSYCVSFKTLSHIPPSSHPKNIYPPPPRRRHRPHKIPLPVIVLPSHRHILKSSSLSRQEISLSEKVALAGGRLLPDASAQLVLLPTRGERWQHSRSFIILRRGAAAFKPA